MVDKTYFEKVSEYSVDFDSEIRLRDADSTAENVEPPLREALKGTLKCLRASML